ncbi:MAG: polyhydroxyalkanoic acid system family protein, partial [Phenylobacterium sp.]
MSKPITITIPHDLGAAVARQRIEEGFGKISQQFGEAASKALTKTWTGDRMDFSVAA